MNFTPVTPVDRESRHSSLAPRKGGSCWSTVFFFLTEMIGVNSPPLFSPTQLTICYYSSFMSFPVPQTERSDMAMHHLPQQLAPSWCTKPQDTWMAGAGLDMGGLDADDAGPFRWFIDERSLSAPGEREHWTGGAPPIEAGGRGVGC